MLLSALQMYYYYSCYIEYTICCAIYRPAQCCMSTSHGENTSERAIDITDCFQQLKFGRQGCGIRRKKCCSCKSCECYWKEIVQGRKQMKQETHNKSISLMRVTLPKVYSQQGQATCLHTCFTKESVEEAAESRMHQIICWSNLLGLICY